MKLPALLFLPWLLLSMPAQADSVRILSEEWPPFIYAEDDQIKGADKDITEYLLNQMGYQVSWELVPWRRVLHDVANGHADAILDIAPHATYLDTYLFSPEPLSSHETVLFYDRRRPFAFQHLDDLQNLVIGVSPGYLYNNDDFIHADTFTREPAPSFEANLQKLLRGRVDLVALSRPVGLYTARAIGIAPRVGYHPVPLSRSDFHLAFHDAEHWQEPSQAFAQALREFKKTEHYTSILRSYGLELANGELTLAP